MAREIKFRAWDKTEKKFIPKGFVQIDGSGQQHWLMKDLTWLMPSKDKALEIMQYTGLKDKNGKEIYEGDIIHWIDNNGETRADSICWSNGDLAWIVNEAWLLCQTSEREVIGNIYENKEG